MCVCRLQDMMHAWQRKTAMATEMVEGKSEDAGMYVCTHVWMKRRAPRGQLRWVRRREVGACTMGIKS